MPQLQIPAKGEVLTRREAYLWLAQQRALDCLARGEWKDAIASMLSELSRHPKLRRHPGKLVSFYCSDLETTRKWIQGFR